MDAQMTRVLFPFADSGGLQFAILRKACQSLVANCSGQASGDAGRDQSMIPALAFSKSKKNTSVNPIEYSVQVVQQQQ